jgi:hypothetical protein
MSELPLPETRCSEALARVKPVHARVRLPSGSTIVLDIHPFRDGSSCAMESIAQREE